MSFVIVLAEKMADVSLAADIKRLATVSAFSNIPARRGEPKHMSYFNSDSEVPEVSAYDQMFHQVDGYDARLQRDDRKHDKGRGLHINEEEKSRAVPVLSSSEYGRHPVPVLYQTGLRYPRIESVNAVIFRVNGITWNAAKDTDQ